MKRNIIPVTVFATILIFILFSVLSHAQETIKPKGAQQSTPEQRPLAQMQKPPEEPLVLQGKEADITIFFTGDAIGYIEECG